jgi:uncharacterized membrane protein
MPPAVLIARLIGPLFVAIGVGVLINAPFYVGSVIEGVHSPTLVYMSGVASMLAGLAMLNAYRAWTADWRVIVTILGWLMAIGGIVRIVLPQVAATVAPELYSGPTALMITGAIVLVLGGILTVKGYRA